MNSFTLALVSSLLLATLVVTASDKISESSIGRSGGDSAAQVRECSDYDDCDEQRCCKHETIDVDAISVYCTPKPDDGGPCNSGSENAGQSK
ncbi:uncharacterized protein LOC115324277 [Ixodes scapularis]|uniref:uncharacterized protein LOC115324277 n=1 Tax=Ixodes scapularis TaxID=6945 RepID=UPI001A9D2005|nr:uncharacterized protein LOC115324277 [Ixodes scapularis]